MSVEHFQALPKGVRLNQYEMLGILGAGGFGITYMARDTTLDTMVAIKEYLPGDFAVRQGDSQVTAKSSTSKGDFDWGLSHFLDEARVLAKFRHPNIVRVNQIFQANNTAYIVMEYAKGDSLDELLKRVGHLSEQQTKDILFPILDGLKRVHALGFLHRDIKPANIIIRDEGGAVLIDFGAARQAVETKSRAITSIVTEGYAPLEQYDTKGNQGAWTDIYALGGVAYKCLTGDKPPAATSRLRNDPLVPLEIAANGRVSKEFAAAIDSALRVFENQRPQNIDAFAALISGAAQATPTDLDEATRIWRGDAPRGGATCLCSARHTGTAGARRNRAPLRGNDEARFLGRCRRGPSRHRGGWMVHPARRKRLSACREPSWQTGCSGPTIGWPRTRRSAGGGIEPSRTIAQPPECRSRLIRPRRSTGGGTKPNRTIARPPQCCSQFTASSSKRARDSAAARARVPAELRLRKSQQ